jgi:hypothetical protein
MLLNFLIHVTSSTFISPPTCLVNTKEEGELYYAEKVYI